MIITVIVLIARSVATGARMCHLYSPDVVSVVAVGMLVGVCVGVVALVAVLRCLHSVKRFVLYDLMRMRTILRSIILVRAFNR